MDSAEKENKSGSKKAELPMTADITRQDCAFEFSNGDRYEGQCLAVKQPLSVVRDGKGIYWGSDDSVYKGNWRNDILEEVDEVIFPDKSVFVGSLDNMIIEGPGLYRYKEGVEIRGYFINNQIIGNLELTDPNGHEWKALNPNNDDEVFFQPVQPFWTSLFSINNLILPYGEAEINTE